MGKKTGISWTDHTFNPWRGCTKVSTGCAHCYAETLSKRNPGVLGVWGDNGTRVVAAESYWREPLKWDREAKAAGERRRVFCASLADVFEQWDEPMRNARGHELGVNNAGTIWSYDEGMVDDDWGVREYTMDDVRDRLLGYIVNTPNLDWLLLSKRIESVVPTLERLAKGPLGSGRATARKWLDGSPPPNVWLGASVENRAAKTRIDFLRKIPAAVRFLSIEPLLEDLGELDLTGIHWTIYGGESGPHARWCDLAWIRDGVRQCRAAGVAPFVKQLGASPFDSTQRISIDGPDSHAITVDLRDSHGGDWSEWPDDLRVRELPKGISS